jgi:hypothetical protein
VRPIIDSDLLEEKSDRKLDKDRSRLDGCYQITAHCRSKSPHIQEFATQKKNAPYRETCHHLGGDYCCASK